MARRLCPLLADSDLAWVIHSFVISHHCYSTDERWQRNISLLWAHQMCPSLSSLTSLRILSLVQGFGPYLQGAQSPGPSISNRSCKAPRWRAFFTALLLGYNRTFYCKSKSHLCRKQGFLRGLSETMQWTPTRTKNHHKLSTPRAKCSFSTLHSLI